MISVAVSVAFPVPPPRTEPLRPNTQPLGGDPEVTPTHNRTAPPPREGRAGTPPRALPDGGFGPKARAGLFAAETEPGVDDDSRATAAKAHEPTKPPEAAKTGTSELTDEQERVVDELAARDREVRAHEEAHARVGGQYAGQPSYTFQTGPDGRRYAIGGEVPIDVAPVPDDPEATIDKMRIVKAAALAPAEPSQADRRVAQIAEAQSLAAQAELSSQAADLLAGPEGAAGTGTASAASDQGPTATPQPSNGFLAAVTQLRHVGVEDGGFDGRA